MFCVAQLCVAVKIFFSLLLLVSSANSLPKVYGILQRIGINVIFPVKDCFSSRDSLENDTKIYNIICYHHQKFPGTTLNDVVYIDKDHNYSLHSAVSIGF